ncbi:MAG TPA: DUF3108 domain-containing protein [Geomonas sp.]|nr:DUF3108 domain-containing protein [Geomonas sp.]
MSRSFLKKHPLISSCLCSILVHVVLAQAAGLLARYDLGPAVAQPPAVAVELSDPSPAATPAVSAAHAASQPTAPAAAGHGNAASSTAAAGHENAGSSRAAADHGNANSSTDAAADTASPLSSPPGPFEPVPPLANPAPPAPRPPLCEGGTGGISPAVASSAPFTPSSAAAQVPPSTQLQSVSDFLSSRYEKLSYQISMHGLPIGTAELESKSEQGITSITLRVRSNAAFSGIYPVEDLVETQHVGGLYIMTRISQREGSFSSEESFTINLRKKRVSWFDLKRPRSLVMTVPTENVLDSLSGIYYLRNRPLQVGRTESLYIYDSESYAEVPVQILRREKSSLPNFSEVNTLVVRPLQKTAGIFRRTGDLQIWLTDDAARVPVKIEAAIALGTVTARLVSAESKPYAASTTAKAAGVSPAAVTPSSPCPSP